MGTVTDIAWAAVAGGTITVGAGVAGTITAGVITVVTTETLIRRVLLSSIHCPDESRHRRYGRSRRQARPVQLPARPTRSAQLHLHRDPNQVGMVLGAEFLLQQRGGVGHGLVGNIERVGDFDDFVAATQQTQDFQFARRH